MDENRIQSNVSILSDPQISLGTTQEITSATDTAVLTLSLPVNHLNQRGRICYAYHDPVWLMLTH
jgi:hypothetical protein